MTEMGESFFFIFLNNCTVKVKSFPNKTVLCSFTVVSLVCPVKDQWGKFTESMQLRWSVANRCRADATVTRPLSQPGRNSPQLEQTSFVSQQHWTTSLFYTDAQHGPENKASLPCGTVPLYCHCSSLHCCAGEWALLSRLMVAFSTADTWTQKWVTITDTFIKQASRSYQHTHTHAEECSRTGQQSWRAGIPDVCPHCATFLSISCSRCYREVGMGPGEHVDWRLSVFHDTTARAYRFFSSFFAKGETDCMLPLLIGEKDLHFKTDELLNLPWGTENVLWSNTVAIKFQKSNNPQVSKNNNNLALKKNCLCFQKITNIGAIIGSDWACVLLLGLKMVNYHPVLPDVLHPD